MLCCTEGTIWVSMANRIHRVIRSRYGGRVKRRSVGSERTKHIIPFRFLMQFQGDIFYIVLLL